MPRTAERPSALALLARLILALLVFATVTSHARADDFLTPEQAFSYSTRAEPVRLIVDFRVAPGYYLYRNRMGFATTTEGVSLGAPLFPKGERHNDRYFGDQEVFRGAFSVGIPLATGAVRPAHIALVLKLQGCADAGLCYAPQTWNAQVPLAQAADSPLLGGLIAPRAAKGDGFLPPEQAFVLAASRDGPGLARLAWRIADGYYLYRNRITVEAADAAAPVGELKLPEGLAHEDEFFGPQQIYRGALSATIALNSAGPAALIVTYQGCADAGLCYPPQRREIKLAPARSASGPPIAEQDRLATLVAHGNLLLVIATFFGAGLLLAFTPCVLPMVPILSGIIAGDGATTTPLRGFTLALAYVLGMAFTYTIAGAAFAAVGQQAQSFFQQTWLIGLFALMFVVLALAMFGFYELQMPSAVQTFFANASGRIRGGKLLSTALLGAISSLVVTACVAPPLVAALAVIGQTGDVARGALALFALSFGMGTPLLVVGASAGRLLPKAGPWMETVKAVFGVLFLGVAVWLLDRILPPRATLAAWGLVALVLAWVVTSVGLKSARRTRTRLALGAVPALYGTVLIVGAVLGGTDPLRPFAGSSLAGANSVAETLPFKRIRTIEELDSELAAARAAHQPAMLDFYADWCVSCKEMDKDTFRDPSVRAALSSYRLLQADVTKNDAADQALLHRFRIFGPPTTVFFAADGRERVDYRLVGYANPAEFKARLAAFAQAQ